MKIKHFSLRLPEELYKKLMKKALENKLSDENNEETSANAIVVKALEKYLTE